MHDIDRTTMEFGQETGFESGEYEFGGESEWSGEGGLLSEQEEMELANELLTVNNEQELEQFLGSLIKKVVDVGGQIIKSPVGQAVGGVLKGVAKKALPLAGGALGGFFGGPLGAKIGSGLASAAGGALGLEAEGPIGEDREYEGARQFVKLAADTVNKAAQATGGDPRAIAQSAALAAARQFAPGLLARPNGGGQSSRQGNGQQGNGQQRTGQQGFGQQGFGMQIGGQQGADNGRRQGRWARQGNKVVIYGI